MIMKNWCSGINSVKYTKCFNQNVQGPTLVISTRLLTLVVPLQLAFIVCLLSCDKLVQEKNPDQ